MPIPNKAVTTLRSQADSIGYATARPERFRYRQVGRRVIVEIDPPPFWPEMGRQAMWMAVFQLPFLAMLMYGAYMLIVDMGMPVRFYIRSGMVLAPIISIVGIFLSPWLLTRYIQMGHRFTVGRHSMLIESFNTVFRWPSTRRRVPINDIKSFSAGQLRFRIRAEGGRKWKKISIGTAVDNREVACLLTQALAQVRAGSAES